MASFCIIAVVSFVASLCMFFLFLVIRASYASAREKTKSKKRQRASAQALQNSQAVNTGSHAADFDGMVNQLRDWSGGKGGAPGARPGRRYRQNSHRIQSRNR